MYKPKTLFHDGRFVLTRHTNLNTKKFYYTVLVHWWAFIGINCEDIRDQFDPEGNRSTVIGNAWKFKNKKQAEQLIMIALLKWPK